MAEMKVVEGTDRMPLKGPASLMDKLRRRYRIGDRWIIRIVVPYSDSEYFNIEHAELIDERLPVCQGPRRYVLDYRQRKGRRGSEFNVVLLVPTGIGCEIGGHAGDGGPTARLLGSIADVLVVHPNVVNASDINEMPDNAIYVEGSAITRLLMGEIGLGTVLSNRVLVVIDDHKDDRFTAAAINAVSAARATYGLTAEVVKLDPPVKMKAKFSPDSGRAVGEVTGLTPLCELLDARRGTFDALALASVIDVPYEYHLGYFALRGGMVNPWGGVEAMLTHALSYLYNIPVAHAPMFESAEIANLDPGVVDPRMAAEAISETFLQCVLKGLHRSPAIVGPSELGSFAVEDVDVLIIPDGCLGLPTIAALEQGIIVVEVKENSNVMDNDLGLLPWARGQYYRVANYLEAAGVLSALKAGMAPASVRRPLSNTVVDKVGPN